METDGKFEVSVNVWRPIN